MNTSPWWLTNISPWTCVLMSISNISYDILPNSCWKSSWIVYCNINLESLYISKTYVTVCTQGSNKSAFHMIKMENNIYRMNSQLKLFFEWNQWSDKILKPRSRLKKGSPNPQLNLLEISTSFFNNLRMLYTFFWIN